jgi:hypothetical protein
LNKAMSSGGKAVEVSAHAPKSPRPKSIIATRVLVILSILVFCGSGKKDRIRVKCLVNCCADFAHHRTIEEKSAEPLGQSRSVCGWSTLRPRIVRGFLPVFYSATPTNNAGFQGTSS